ncbi:MAG: sulfurtransferase TusA family protein [Deltaproteobacteria bacterium]|nr:sulfurtransferase TusA family protein [Deltaproteobacteria bacterium]
MKHDYELDTFGLFCPVPVMKVIEELKNIPEGSVLKVIASDGGIIEDLKSYCKKTNHDFLSYEINLPEYIVYVKK